MVWEAVGRGYNGASDCLTLPTTQGCIKKILSEFDESIKAPQHRSCPVDPGTDFTDGINREMSIKGEIETR